MRLRGYLLGNDERLVASLVLNQGNVLAAITRVQQKVSHLVKKSKDQELASQKFMYEYRIAQEYAVSICLEKALVVQASPGVDEALERLLGFLGRKHSGKQFHDFIQHHLSQELDLFRRHDARSLRGGLSRSCSELTYVLSIGRGILLPSTLPELALDLGLDIGRLWKGCTSVCWGKHSRIQR